MDMTVVTNSRAQRAQHLYVGEEDHMHLGFDYLLRQAQAGSHQSCEAAFSRSKVFTRQGEPYRAMLSGLRVTSPEAFAKYERTITLFSFGDFKRRRHAVRLAFNLRDLRRSGRFDPELTPIQQALVNAYAKVLRDADLVAQLLPGRGTRSEDTARLRREGRRFGRSCEDA
ncbi:hypothetical protein [Microbacterium sp. 13-71-7]|uniref:hypothetical protein n=1 Tax=Microbacterium sp. 13-71-7 TaxID=1970399 RepID=UPI0025F7894B|nr:hypothetical protein [Microbacterium sp. 13-71-7]